MAFNLETLKHFWDHIDTLKANKDECISVDMSNTNVGSTASINANLLNGKPADYYAKAETGLPEGGTVGQFLAKNSNVDYDATWQDIVIPEGISIELLWENAAPTSSFAAQTIELDLENYDLIMVEASYVDTNDNALYFSQIAKNIINNNITHSFSSGTSGSSSYSQHRYSKIVENGIAFADAKRNGSTTNTACIPVRVYGIKGVK